MLQVSKSTNFGRIWAVEVCHTSADSGPKLANAGQAWPEFVRIWPTRCPNWPIQAKFADVLPSLAGVEGKGPKTRSKSNQIREPRPQIGTCWPALAHRGQRFGQSCFKSARPPPNLVDVCQIRTNLSRSRAKDGQIRANWARPHPRSARVRPMLYRGGGMAQCRAEARPTARGRRIAPTRASTRGPRTDPPPDPKSDAPGDCLRRILG